MFFNLLKRDYPETILHKNEKIQTLEIIKTDRNPSNHQKIKKLRFYIDWNSQEILKILQN